MTPEERRLVTELFDRLAALEDAERDPAAERLINDGLRQAPNAAYALVQTALVQDEALKRANARIRELEDELGGEPEPARPAGFLDNVRGALFGAPEPPRATSPRTGSVPSVRPGEASAGFRPGAQPMAEPYPPQGGGSFLGNAAAAAAGTIGGSLLLGGIRSMMGGHQGGSGGGAHAAVDPSHGSQRDLTTPWSNSESGDLARQAGIDKIGSSAPQGDAGGDNRSHGLFGNADDHAGNDDTGDDHADDDDADDMDDMDPDDFDDDGGFDSGGDN